MSRLSASLDLLITLEDRFGELTDLLGASSWPFDDDVEADNDDSGRVQL